MDKLQELCNSKYWVSYREMCDILEMPYYSGNSKICQLKRLEKICKIEKRGVHCYTKYRIKKIY